MEPVSKNVADIQPDQRSAFESILGHKLAENQRVIIQVMEIDASSGDASDISQTYAAQQEALASVWDDAELDQYTDQDGTPIQ
jgi:hypothetical protein